MEYNHVKLGLELFKEDLGLTVNLQLGDKQQILTNDTLALDNDVVISTVEVSLEGHELIDVISGSLLVIVVIGTIE